MKLSSLLGEVYDPSSREILENMGIKLFEFSEHDDERGVLSHIEFVETFNFNFKRYFFISKIPVNVWRGNHAHRLCFQLLHCIGPTIELELDNLKNKITLTLDSTRGLILIPPKTWVSFKSLNPNSILAVFASEFYDEKDYINDYDLFKEESQLHD
jgi:dTDP-4-dehydrorhamnose 3,5-epimerase-like enzyme